MSALLYLSCPIVAAILLSKCAGVAGPTTLREARGALGNSCPQRRAYVSSPSVIRRLLPQLRLTRRALRLDLHQEPHQVEELLPALQLVHEPGWHRRDVAHRARVELVLPHLELLPARGLTQHEQLLVLAHEESGHDQAIVGAHDVRLVPLADRGRGVEHGLNEERVGHALSLGREVGAQALAARRVVAADAGERRVVEERGAGLRVAVRAGRGGQGLRILLGEALRERDVRARAGDG